MEWNGGEETHRKKSDSFAASYFFLQQTLCFYLMRKGFGEDSNRRAETREKKEKSAIKYQQFRINAYYILAEIFPNYALEFFHCLQRLFFLLIFFYFHHANSHHVAFMLCYIFIPSHKLDACVIIAHKDGKKFELYSHSFTPFVSCAIESWFDVDDDDDSGADQVRIGLAYECCFFFYSAI